MIMKMVLVMLLLLLIPLSQAQPEAGEKISVNGYVMDFSYSPAAPAQDEKVSMVLKIANETTSQYVNADTVLVTISLENGVFFTGTLDMQLGNTAFMYAFPKGGSYQVNARFMKGSGVLAERGFIVDIEGKPEMRNDFFQLILLVNVLLLVVVALLLWKVRKG